MTSYPKGKAQLLYNQMIKEEAEAKLGAPVSRFQSVERGTQSRNSMMREVEVQTQGPPKELFTGNVDRWVGFNVIKMLPVNVRGIIHHVYLHYEKKAESREANNEETHKPRRLLTSQKSCDDDNTEVERMLLSAKILERMINQNIYSDIAFDFKYWEDRSDDFKEQEGSVYPLWRFECEVGECEDVTCLVWNSLYSDMFAAGYGSYNFYQQPQSGRICIFTLKNCSYPEYLLAAPAGVLSLDFHPRHPQLLVAGLADGNVAVYNLVRNRHRPTLLSDRDSGKHSDHVWSVVWSGDDIDGYRNFISTSADGTVKLWTVVRTFLRQTELLKLSFTKVFSTDDVSGDLADGGTAVSLCPGGEDEYLVGTENGDLHVCTTHCSSTTLLRNLFHNSINSFSCLCSFQAHSTPVRSLHWNYFITDIFLSCGTEMTVKIWRKGGTSPLFIFKLQNQVTDACWSPYSSTVFGASTVDGRVHIYDLSINKYSAICCQAIVPR